MSVFQRMGKGQKVVEHMYSILRPSVEIARITSNLYSSWGELGHKTVLLSQGGRLGVESWLYAQLKLHYCGGSVESILLDSYKSLPPVPSLSLYYNMCSIVLFIYPPPLACEFLEDQGLCFCSQISGL